MRTEFESETNLFFFLLTYPPPQSLLVSRELNTPFPFRNEKVETVVVDDAPPILLKFIHLAMRIVINRKLLKEKNLKPISERGKGGGGGPVPYDARSCNT